MGHYTVVSVTGLPLSDRWGSEKRVPKYDISLFEYLWYKFDIEVWDKFVIYFISKYDISLFEYLIILKQLKVL